MTRDSGRSSGPGRGLGGLSPEVAHCAEVGERLSRTPRAERDLAWHVMAYQVGDLGALAAARLRTSVDTVPGR
ncbi:MAG TPA: hypothetical protein VMF07_00910 [Solirubrobacteraceae bacterium]|nr:hypothetical protein [Solirubrobacteraceae bacterium]